MSFADLTLSCICNSSLLLRLAICKMKFQLKHHNAWWMYLASAKLILHLRSGNGSYPADIQTWWRDEIQTWPLQQLLNDIAAHMHLRWDNLTVYTFNIIRSYMFKRRTVLNLPVSSDFLSEMHSHIRVRPEMALSHSIAEVDQSLDPSWTTGWVAPIACDC